MCMFSSPGATNYHQSVMPSPLYKAVTFKMFGVTRKPIYECIKIASIFLENLFGSDIAMLPSIEHEHQPNLMRPEIFIITLLQYHGMHTIYSKVVQALKSCLVLISQCCPLVIINPQLMHIHKPSLRHHRDACIMR